MTRPYLFLNFLTNEVQNAEGHELDASGPHLRK